jgi:hypothetical protein
VAPLRWSWAARGTSEIHTKCSRLGGDQSMYCTLLGHNLWQCRFAGVDLYSLHIKTRPAYTVSMSCAGVYPSRQGTHHQNNHESRLYLCTMLVHYGAQPSLHSYYILAPSMDFDGILFTRTQSPNTAYNACNFCRKLKATGLLGMTTQSQTIDQLALHALILQLRCFMLINS